jgi:hypothetical protein
LEIKSNHNYLGLTLWWVQYWCEARTSKDIRALVDRFCSFVDIQMK